MSTPTRTEIISNIHDYISDNYDYNDAWYVIRMVDISPHINIQQRMIHVHRLGVETPNADVILLLKPKNQEVSPPPGLYLYLWDDAIWSANSSTESWDKDQDGGLLKLSFVSNLND